MSTYQRLTLIGLYNYEQQYDRDLFSSLSLPSGYDKPTFINSLLLEHGEKCVMYTDPTFMRSAIGIWSGKWSLELERIYQALVAEYNPIYNYDRFEESEDGRGKNYTSEVTGGASSDSQTNEGRSAFMASESDEGRAASSTSASEEGRAREEFSNTSENRSGASDSTSNTSLDSTSETNGTTSEATENSHTAKDTPKYDVTNEQITSANNEHQVSADNDSSYQPESKDILNSGKTKTNTDGATQDLTENTSNITDGATAENTTRSESGNTTAATTNAENVEGNAHTSNAESANTSTQSTNSENINASSRVSNDENAAMQSHNESANNSKTVDNEQESNSHRAHLYGNIGVTTSASMVSEIVEQRIHKNLYEIATGLFAKELLIGLW